MDNVKHTIKICIRANSAESGPPLGTVLGNLGVNAVKFAKDFNEYTADLPNIYKINVIISIYRNNSFSFITDIPSTGYILSILKRENPWGNYYIKFSDVIKLAMLKFPLLPLKTSVKIILGSVKSCNNIKIHLKKKKIKNKK